MYQRGAICALSVHYLCSICAIYAQIGHKWCTDNVQMVRLWYNFGIRKLGRNRTLNHQLKSMKFPQILLSNQRCCGICFYNFSLSIFSVSSTVGSIAKIIPLLSIRNILPPKSIILYFSQILFWLLISLKFRHG
jgi:hypothetical protein